MTTTAAIRTGTARTQQATSRPKLKVLNQEAIRQRARRRNALVFLFIVVLLALFAVALVHAQLVAGQQDLDAVRSRIAEAEAHRAKVARLVDEASAPETIISRAEELGMVRAKQPVYLEAISPVRDLPTVAAYVPSGPPEHLDVAAGVSAGSPAIATGISGSASITPVPDVQLAQGQPAEAVEAVAPTASAGSVPVASGGSVPVASGGSVPVASAPAVETTPAVGGTVVSTGGAFSGVSVTTGSGNASAANRTSGVAGASTAVGGGGVDVGGVDVGGRQVRSSFAGSSAMAGGNRSG